MTKSPSNIQDRHYTYIAAIFLAAIALLWLAWVVLVPTPAFNESQRANITQGQGLYSIADTLKSGGLIRNSTVFITYVYIRGWERELKAGDYILPARSSMPDIAYQLAHGLAESNDVEVVVPEGSNIWEVDRILTTAGFSTGTSFAGTYYLQDGMFFPDTYRFNPGSTGSDVASKMEQNFTVRTKDLLGGISDGELSRIITIASILEKEAQTEGDMRLVAGVIKNRLARHMPLEIDATVSYGACVREYAISFSHDCDVSYIAVGTEIHIDSPFNSYTRQGLPPRPISNPGLQAIEAALHPEGDFLYYLSPRGGGALIFAHTAAEHIANRRKYLGL